MSGLFGVKMNVGEAVADLAIASQVGKLNNAVAPVSSYVQAYAPKGLAATVALNNRLGVDQVVQGRGSAMAPFKTWAALIGAMGKPTTKAGYEAMRVIDVYGGTYDVSTAKLPMGTWCINLRGGATLTGKLTWEMDSTLAFGSALPPTLVVLGDEGSPGAAAIPDMELTQATTTGVVATAAASVALRWVTFGQITSPAGITALALDLERCQPPAAFVNPAAVIVAHRINWPSTLSCKSIDAEFGFMNGNVTVLAVVGFGQFRGTTFSTTPHVFTGAASSLMVDGYSNYTWKVGPWTLAGGATKVVTSDNTA